MTCSGCTAPLAQDAAFCGECGTPVPRCSSCAVTLRAGAAFCHVCGTSSAAVSSVTPLAATAPEASATVVRPQAARPVTPPPRPGVVPVQQVWTQAPAAALPVAMDAGPVGSYVPAGFGQRLGARIIDALVGVAQVVVLYAALVGAILMFGSPSGALVGLLLGPLIISLGSGIAFFIYLQICETRGGRTLGRAAAGIRVISLRPDAGPEARLTGGQAFVRRFVEGLGEMLLGLGALSMLGDAQRRTWGDKASGTAVIRDRTRQPGTKKGRKVSSYATAGTAAIVFGLVAITTLSGTGQSSDSGSCCYTATSSTNNYDNTTSSTDTSTTGTGDTSGGTLDPSASSQVATSAQVPDQAPPGVDAAGNTVTYGPDNMLDNDPSTAWRTAGDGTGNDIQISLSGTKVITSIGIINGYAKTDPSNGIDRYTQERRITQVTWNFPNGQTYQQTLDPNVETMQTLNLPDQPSADSVTLHIDSTTEPGDPNYDYTSISDVDVEGQTT